MKKKFLILMTFVISFLMLTNVYATGTKKYGDVNLDGEVNMNDYMLLLRYLDGNKDSISEEARVYADLNGDSQIDDTDRVILKRHLLDMEGYDVLPLASANKVYAYGDVNLDDRVNQQDVDALIKYLLGNKDAITEEGKKYADLNEDGKIDNTDLIILIRHIKEEPEYRYLSLSSDTKVYAYGDVNLDGEVNNKDLALYVEYLNGNKDAISEEGLKYADLNDDQKVNNVDRIILLRHLLNWEGYEILPLITESKVYAYGDVNLDGEINQKDIDALTDYLAGDESAISEEGLKYADLNEDGKIDNKDLIILIRYVEGWGSYKNLPVSSDKEIYETGDINQDGKVDEKDLEKLKNHLEKDEGTLKDDELKLADINQDGKVDKDDLTELEKILNPNNEKNPSTGDNLLYVIATLSIVTLVFGSVAYRKMRQN